MCAYLGFRVYKSFDPRARVMRRVAHELLAHLNIRRACVCAMPPHSSHQVCAAALECCCRSQWTADCHGDERPRTLVPARCGIRWGIGLGLTLSGAGCLPPPEFSLSTADGCCTLSQSTKLGFDVILHQLCMQVRPAAGHRNGARARGDARPVLCAGADKLNRLCQPKAPWHCHSPLQ